MTSATQTIEDMIAALGPARNLAERLMYDDLLRFQREDAELEARVPYDVHFSLRREAIVEGVLWIATTINRYREFGGVPVRP